MDGYIKDEETRVWRRQQIEPFAYTDGDEVEDRLYKALKGVKDRRVFGGFSPKTFSISKMIGPRCIISITPDATFYVR